MADNGDRADALLDFLRSTRASVRLPSALVEVTHRVLLETFEIESQEDLMGLGAQIVWTAIEGAGNDRILPVHGELFFRWLNDTPVRPQVINLITPPRNGEGGGNQAADNNTAGANTGDPNTVNMIEADAKAGELNKNESARLALELETGQVHMLEEVADLPFGSNPQLCTVAKARRKAGLPALSKLIDKKDGTEIIRHLTNLVRDLSAAGRTVEAALVTSFLMETQQLYTGDMPTMVEYLKLYLRKYMGRGVPVKFDFSLHAQALSSTASSKAGGLTEEQKEAIKAGKQAASKIEALTQKLTSLTSQVTELKKGGPTLRSGDKTCDFCGQKGHIARSCKLNPESTNFDAKFAAKQAEKKGESEE